LRANLAKQEERLQQLAEHLPNDSCYVQDEVEKKRWIEVSCCDLSCGRLAGWPGEVTNQSTRLDYGLPPPSWRRIAYPLSKNYWWLLLLSFIRLRHLARWRTAQRLSRHRAKH
jgi:hypothetical protein